MAVSSLPKRSRSFAVADAEASEQVEVAPLGFDIAGESFEVLPEVPGIILLEFIEATTSDVAGANAAALTKFLKSIMTPEDWTRLDAVLHDPKNMIDIKTISAIVKFIIEEYTARPTEAS